MVKERVASLTLRVVFVARAERTSWKPHQLERQSRRRRPGERYETRHVPRSDTQTC